MQCGVEAAAPNNGGVVRGNTRMGASLFGWPPFAISALLLLLAASCCLLLGLDRRTMVVQGRHATALDVSIPFTTVYSLLML